MFQRDSLPPRVGPRENHKHQRCRDGWNWKMAQLCLPKLNSSYNLTFVLKCHHSNADVIAINGHLQMNAVGNGRRRCWFWKRFGFHLSFFFDQSNLSGLRLHRLSLRSRRGRRDVTHWFVDRCCEAGVCRFGCRHLGSRPSPSWPHGNQPVNGSDHMWMAEDRCRDVKYDSAWVVT